MKTRLLPAVLLTLTAVAHGKDITLSNDPVTFDPRAIRGNFRFVATLHETLQPRGHQEDTSIWVFISDVPFNQASGGR